MNYRRLKATVIHSMKLRRGQIQALMDLANTRIMEWNAHLQSRIVRHILDISLHGETIPDFCE